jgi:phage tail-like protein
MTRSIIEDPLKNYRFRVEVDGFVRAGFSNVGGLSRSTQVAEYREGGMNETAQKSAAQSSFPNLSLTRGLIIAPGIGAADYEYWDAQIFRYGVLGNPGEYRRDLRILLYDATGAEAKAYRVLNAFVADFKAFGELAGLGNENLMEVVELAHEGWYLEGGANQP